MQRVRSSQVLDAETLLFNGVTWDFYDMFIDSLGQRPSRVSFDGQTLEMAITLSIEHEGLKSFIGQLISDISTEFKIPMKRGESTTLRFKKKKKGLEPDKCFWIQNAPAVTGIKRLNLNVHPVPDLVLEIDVTHASVNREEIYASIRIPEMWHYARSTGLTAWRNVEGQWARIEYSDAFPAILIRKIDGYVQRFVAGEPECELFEAFRKY